MDQNNNFTMLEDPNNVFQCKEQVTALKTSNDGSTLFIYCDLQYLYKWDAQNYFQLLTEDQSLAAIAVDSQNNLFAGAYYTVLIDKVPNCLYTFFNASNNYAGNTSDFLIVQSVQILTFPGSEYLFAGVLLFIASGS